MKRLALVFIALFGLSGCTTYYVSPTGSDSNPGTQEQPWRTVAKANQAPTDSVVRFKGGATYAGTLNPSSRNVAYSNYEGIPTIGGGIFLDGDNSVAFDNLRVTGVGQGVLASSSAVTSNVNLSNLIITNTTIGVNSANPGNANWTLDNVTVDGTADSGLLLQGSDFTVKNSTIRNTGHTWASLSHHLHGIYSKVLRLKVQGSRIGSNYDPEGEGISTRFRSALIENNDISDHAWGIGYYRDDPGTGGTSIVRNNRFTGIHDAGVYIDNGGNTVPGMVEDWQIVDNSWTGDTADAVLQWTPNGRSVELARNTWSGFNRLYTQAGPGLNVHDNTPPS